MQGETWTNHNLLKYRSSIIQQRFTLTMPLNRAAVYMYSAAWLYALVWAPGT